MMMKKKTGFMLCWAISLFFACSPKNSIPTGSGVAAKDVNDNKEIFAEAKLIYNSKCATCHAPKNPSLYSPEALTRIVPSMVAKTNKRAGSEVINASQQQALLEYLLTICKK